MEPITLVTIALTLLATKATEKVGEKIGEGAIASAKRLLDVLQRKVSLDVSGGLNAVYS